MFLILITDLKNLLQNWGGQSQSPCCGLEVVFKTLIVEEHQVDFQQSS